MVMAYELLRPVRHADQRNETGNECQTWTSKLIEILHVRIACRVIVRNRGEIVNPIDDIRERRQDEIKSEEHEGEAVEIGARETADAHARIYVAADKPGDEGRQNPEPRREDEQEHSGNIRRQNSKQTTFMG